MKCKRPYENIKLARLAFVIITSLASSADYRATTGIVGFNALELLTLNRLSRHGVQMVGRIVGLEGREGGISG